MNEAEFVRYRLDANKLLLNSRSKLMAMQDYSEGESFMAAWNLSETLFDAIAAIKQKEDKDE